MNFSNSNVKVAQAMFQSSSTQQHPLGTRGVTPDGRVYRYCQAGAVDLVAGTVIQSPAIPAGQLARAIHTTSPTGIGATAISLTCGSSVASGFYNEGFLVTASGTGQGFTYTINNHPAVSTGATGLFTLYPEDALPVAITAATTVSLFPNKYRGVVIMPATTATGVVVGVASYIITAGQFGWIQTWGPCGVIGDDTTALGAVVDGVAATSGRMRGQTLNVVSTTSLVVTGQPLTGQVIGHLLQTNVQGQVCMVDLTISP